MNILATVRMALLVVIVKNAKTPVHQIHVALEEYVENRDMTSRALAQLEEMVKLVRWKETTYAVVTHVKMEGLVRKAQIGTHSSAYAVLDTEEITVKH